MQTSKQRMPKRSCTNYRKVGNARQAFAWRTFVLIIGTILLPAITGCVQLPSWGKDTLQQANDSTGHDLETLDGQFSLARLVERKSDLVESQVAYLEILAIDPEYAPALHRLGVVAVKLEQLDKALEYFEKAILLAPESVELLGDLGYTYFLKGDLDKASEFLSEASLIAPEDHRIANNFGIVLGHQGRIHECLTLFRRANTESNALTNLGYVFSQTGDYENASRYFHKALDLDPGLEEAANGLVEIYKIQQLVARPGFEPLNIQEVSAIGDVSEIVAEVTDKTEAANR